MLSLSLSLLERQLVNFLISFANKKRRVVHNRSLRHSLYIKTVKSSLLNIVRFLADAVGGRALALLCCLFLLVELISSHGSGFAVLSLDALSNRLAMYLIIKVLVRKFELVSLITSIV